MVDKAVKLRRRGIVYVPGWLFERYAVLWRAFGVREFTRERAARVLQGDSALHVVLSRLRRAGWLRIRQQEKDARRTVYRLEQPTELIVKLISEVRK